MTNEQVAVLLRGYWRRLNVAVAQVEEALPEEVKMPRPNVFGPDSLRVNELDDIREALCDLHEDITDLLKTDER